MQKFNCKFELVNNNDDSNKSLIFANKETLFYFDFLDSDIIRIIQKKKKIQEVPTYFVCPKPCEMPITGRSRNSIEGFPLENFDVNTTDGKVEILSSKYLIKICLSPFCISYYLKDGKEIFCDRLTQSYNINGELGPSLCHYIKRDLEDSFFGLGDKTGNVDRKNKHFEIFCTDAMGYDSEKSDPLYKHIPFYICKKQNTSLSNSNIYYGIFYDTAAKSSMDFGCDLDNYHSLYTKFETEDDALCCYVFLGDIKKIVSNFSKLCGESAFFPKSMLKYNASAMGYAESNNAQEQLVGFIDKCKKLNFDCGGFYLSSGYTTVNNKRYVFNWNYEKIPEPKIMTEAYKKSGIKILANIKPAFLLTHPLYPELEKKGYFLKYPDGSPALCQFWDGLGSYLDFSNIDAFNFWVEKVKSTIIDFGIPYTWNDNNEFEVWDESVIADNFGNPLPAYKMRPNLTMLMLMASKKAQDESKNINTRTMMSTRSGGAGIWRYAQTWSGDNKTDWKTLRGNHKMGIAMSLSGMFNFGHDVGGFDGPRPEAELFLRWLQHGIFMPRFTIHSWKKDGSINEPWMFPEFINEARALFAQRHKIIPYLYNALYDASEYAIPVIAPLFYYFENCDIESDQYMLGQNLLVCNIFDKGKKSITLTLPETDTGWYLTDKLYQSGTCVNIKNNFTDLATFFVKAGCLVPFDESKYSFAFDQESIVFNLYALKNGKFETCFFNDDGISYEYKNNNCVKLKFFVDCQEEKIVVSVKNYGKQHFTPKIKLIDFLNRKLEYCDSIEI